MEHRDNNIRLYSFSEAAKEMHIGKSCLYDLINSGKIETVRVGKHRKIAHFHIVEFIEKYSRKEIANTITHKDVESYLSSGKQKINKETDEFLRKLKAEIN